MMAASGGRHECVWHGDVDVEAEKPEDINERIFRLFNRVSLEDNDRLEAMGYTLPSLSVGDVIIHSGEAWTVAPLGFAPTRDAVLNLTRGSWLAQAT